MAFTITIDASDFIRKMKTLKPKMVEAVRAGMDRLGKNIVKDLRYSLEAGGHIHTGDVWKSLKFHRSGSVGWVSVSKRGIFLDRATPHYVPRKYRRAMAWAEAKLGKRKPFYFRPHPWIDVPIERQLSKAQQIFNEEVRRRFR